MNTETGKFCPLINKDCIREECMFYDAESDFGPLCSVKSTAKYMQQMAGGEEAYMESEEDEFPADEEGLLESEEDIFEEPDEDIEESEDNPPDPENN